jgi:hypothetical protein
VDTNRPFQFQKHSQLFIRAHKEALSVAAIVFRLREHLSFKVRRPPNDHPFSELMRLASRLPRNVLFPLIVFLRSRTDSIPIRRLTLVCASDTRAYQILPADYSVDLFTRWLAGRFVGKRYADIWSN